MRATCLDRFWSHVAVADPGDCWLWTGTLDRDGYGEFALSRRSKVRAHRFVLEITTREPIPAGLLALHSCDAPGCVNPAHLRSGTVRDNALDSVARGRHPHASLTHCIRGHDYDEANTAWTRQGSRRCRACTRLRYHRLSTRPKRPVAQHGSVAKYRAGCRCDDCRRASTDARRARRRRAAA